MVNQSATNTFRKRSYKFTEFAHDVFGLVPALPNFTAVYALPGRMDKRFREKIMLSVSRMNDCRHCTAIHGAWAALAGLSGEDRAALHELDPADMDHRDWVALEYARRVAADAPADLDLETELSALFSEKEIADIAAVARAINIANRCGNTWDAFLSRLQGRPAEDSSLADEFLVLAPLAPFGPAFLVLSKLLQKKYSA